MSAKVARRITARACRATTRGVLGVVVFAVSALVWQRAHATECAEPTPELRSDRDIVFEGVVLESAKVDSGDRVAKLQARTLVETWCKIRRHPRSECNALLAGKLNGYAVSMDSKLVAGFIDHCNPERGLSFN